MPEVEERNKNQYAGEMFPESREALRGPTFTLRHFKRSEFKGQRAGTLPVLQKRHKVYLIY